VSSRITKGNVHDAKRFYPLVREAAEKYDIEKLYADKAHDNRRNFNLLDQLDVEPAIEIRNNMHLQGQEDVIYEGKKYLMKKLGYEEWKRIKDSGKRWIAEIVVFSSIKCVLGEDVPAFKEILHTESVEAGLKVMLYNKFINL
jgi:hypothetical protein